MHHDLFRMNDPVRSIPRLSATMRFVEGVGATNAMSWARGIAAAGLLQATDLALALAIHLTAVRVMTLEAYGTAATVLAWSAMGATLVEYGFNYSAPRRLAGASRRRRELIEAQILVARCALSLLACLIGGVLIVIFQETELATGAVALATVVLCALSPGWRFASNGTYLQFLKIQVACRAVGTTVGILLLLWNPAALSLIASQLASTALLASIGLTYTRMPDDWRHMARRVRLEIKYGFRLFLSTVVVNAQRPIVLTVTGFAFGLHSAGAFAAADKFIQGGSAVRSAVFQLLYSRNMARGGFDRPVDQVGRELPVLVALVAAAIAVSFYLGESTIEYLIGKSAPEVWPVLRAMLITFIPNTVLSYTLVMLCIGRGRDSQLVWANLAELLAYILTLSLFSFSGQVQHAVLCWGVIDLIIASAIGWSFSRYRARIQSYKT